MVHAGTLTIVAQQMRDNPDDADIQKRGCQLIQPLAVDQHKAIKESGVLTLISKIFAGHRSNKQVLKLAHAAMNTMVK